ncbi:MAG: cytochrome c peroxidase [Myxococcota bacterium]
MKRFLCLAALVACDAPRFDAKQRALLASLQLPKELAPSPSNRFADRVDAAALGRSLFFMPELSGSKAISCATCHSPDRYYTDGRKRSMGVGKTLRNAPTLVGAGHHSWFYWDGRRDSLWSQALIPLEAPDEMGGSRTAVLRTVYDTPELRSAYLRVFGEAPPKVHDLPDANPFGSPEQREAWAALAPDRQEPINRAFANIGKALAAFQRTLEPAPSRFDAYVSTGTGFTDLELRGLELFIDDGRTRCLRCHNGPLFSNLDFHNIGTGNFDTEPLDFGRVFGVRAVKRDPFNCLGRYSDAAPEDCDALRFLNRDGHVPLEGAFKVPSLRGVSKTAPYFHDGSKRSLEDVLEHYRSPPAGRHELVPLSLSDGEVRALVAFLRTL